MSSSAHSALASLTANYTDSEPDDDDVDQDESISTTTGDEEKKPVAVQGEASPSPAVSESNSNSRDANSVSSSGGDSASGGSRSKANALGLVSYQDDLIDDDVVDDFDQNSDSTQDNENGSSETGTVSNTVENTMDVAMDITSDKNEVTDLEDISQDKEVTDESEIVQSSTTNKVKLPPEAPGKCPPELQEKFTKLYERKAKQGFNMNTIIQSNKQFRNPSIYEKLIIRCNIDELGTNYPRDIYDPHIWDEYSYYDELAKAQKTEMEKREKERKERTKVEFVSGTVKKTSSNSVPTPGSQMEEPKRKSKWDQKGVMPVFPTAVSTVQPVLVQPPFTANASGTKGTVINAFGSLPKKPKV